MKHSQNKPRRREPYHYDASGAQYIACIETALQHGQSIPVHVLQLVYHRGRSVSLCGGKMRRFHLLCRKHRRCCSSRQECQSSSLPWPHPSDR